MRIPIRIARSSGALAAAAVSAFRPHASLPASPADSAKVLHVAFTSAEMSFDPQFSADAATDGMIDHIFESMLDYDYLVRPAQLVPRTLVAMPTVEDGGATFVFRLKPGIFFTPDRCVQGQAARANRRRPGLRVEAIARSCGQEPVAVAASMAR